MADLLDKVKQGIDKGVTVVSVKSKELIDITRLKNQIGALEDQVKKSIPELGEFVFQMYGKDALDIEGIKEKCAAIVSLETQVGEKQEELKQTRQKAQEALGKSFCPGCDAELMENAKFCSVCGQKIEAKPGEVQSPENEPVH